MEPPPPLSPSLPAEEVQAQMQQSQEVDITIESSSDMSCRSNFERPVRRNVYICGFMSKRLHNQSLLAIAHELMPHYFVGSNATAAQIAAIGRMQSSLELCQQMLGAADLLLLLVNEFTIHDRTCLFCLQTAFELSVPVVMLRSPRTRLVIAPNVAQYYSFMREKTLNKAVVAAAGNSHHHHHHHHHLNCPFMSHNAAGAAKRSTRPQLLDHNSCSSRFNGLDMQLLQSILDHGFKNALIYDRMQHALCMRALQQRLEAVLRRQLGMSSRDKELEGKLMMQRASTANALLPPLPFSPQNLLGEPASGRLTTFRRSFSWTNMLAIPASNENSQNQSDRTPNYYNRSKKRAPQTWLQSQDDINVATWAKRKARQSLAIRRSRSAVPSNRKTFDLKDASSSSIASNLSSTKQASAINSNRNSTGSSVDINDPQLFHETQYLIFHNMDKTQKPKLIHFPADILNSDIEVNSIWGSDSSLEKAALMAPNLQGNLDLPTPPGSPKSMHLLKQLPSYEKPI